MRWLIKCAVTFIVIASLGGCARTVPIANVYTPVGASHTEAEVKNAILSAGLQNKWLMHVTAPGSIKARLQTRGHVAEVRINYSATRYSISYDNSINLLASGGQIHKNYNRWVQNLDQAIQFNLSDTRVH